MNIAYTGSCSSVCYKTRFARVSKGLRLNIGGILLRRLFGLPKPNMGEPTSGLEPLT
jgi:hypothetical protein